ncbi:hypothetical protein N0B16_07510 [Chryseobacterium sp. GMJ5]|uniref:Uncharacterized protein n=1 Tax=Chryseobacterium gilvum TaxID=2976534 RepID=A0ABT2VWY0_9FLAO|nr:hypothetical protein [Chryseobacterium gilvum]MCU7614280.1 hypothetical protein [Chryseobacterium gilvum]
MKIYTKLTLFALLCLVSLNLNAQAWKAKYQLAFGPSTTSPVTSSFYAQWLPTKTGSSGVYPGTTFYVLIPDGVSFTATNAGTGSWTVTTLATGICGYQLVECDLSSAGVPTLSVTAGVPINLIKFTVNGTCPVGTGARLYQDDGTDTCVALNGLIANGLTLSTSPSNGYDGIVNGPTNPLVCASFCYRDPATGMGIDSKQGITLLQRAGANSNNWPMVRKSAFTVLESNSKGFVITRMTTSQIFAIVSPQEGMMVYDTDLKCLKINTDGTAGGWSCFNTAACP